MTNLTLSAPVLAAAQAALFVVLSPMSVGVLQSARARLQGRRGPGPLQFYRDLIKLFRVHPTCPESASIVYFLAPAVAFVSYALLGLALPTVILAKGPSMDLLFVVGLIGLARFVTTLAAFDAASPFGPMSAGRQWFIHLFAEPALLVATYIFALSNHTTNVPQLVPAASGLSLLLTQPSISIALAALLFVLIAEAGRLPFDQPGTHLELTMVEDGVALEYGGKALALMWSAYAMKLTFSLSFIAFLALPPTSAVPSTVRGLGMALLTYLAKLGLLLLALAAWETLRSKMRLRAMLTQLMFAVGVLLFTLASLIVTFIEPRG
jgi:formate hydrogenlyase subunit 4